jgi:hypothetical protein
MKADRTLVEREHLALRGSAPGGGAHRATRRIEELRTCEVPSCQTILSVYNAGVRCWQHQVATRYVPRGSRLRLDVA